jgi:hypothetical protein
VASTGATDMPAAKVRKAPLIIRKSQLADNFTAHPLKAAKQITKKAVFCVDNLYAVLTALLQTSRVS